MATNWMINWVLFLYLFMAEWAFDQTVYFIAFSSMLTLTPNCFS